MAIFLLVPVPFSAPVHATVFDECDAAISALSDALAATRQERVRGRLFFLFCPTYSAL